MASYNRIIIIGNLTRDPEYRQQASGQAVCKLSLASNRQYRNKQTGSLVQEVCYIDVDVWGPQATSCRDYLKKGSPALVEGRLKLDTWEVEGQQRRKHLIVADRVVFLGANSTNESLSEDTLMSPASSLRKENDEQVSNARRAKKKENEVFGDEVAEGSFKDEPPFDEELPF